MARSAFPRSRTGTRTGTRTRVVAVTGVVAALVATASACSSAGDDKDPKHRSFALQGRTLTVDSNDSALDIVAADSNKSGRIEVTRWFSGSVTFGKDPKVTWSMEDDRLKLRVKCSGVVADCSAKHRIEVPRGVSVVVRNGDGSVTAHGFDQALDIRSGDGSVTVRDSTGALKLSTDDGSIRALGVRSRQVRAHSEDGSVRLELASVPDLVESSSDDGSLTIELPRETYRVTADSDDGSVKVSVPRDKHSSHLVSAKTKDGSIRVRSAGE
ncbi:DUF4097 family beta strand repeat-containing protein [Streptomyces turgidiscabies]|uniref:DUF4097 domain-containing protein n=1 Tax=Streptomyces turgidiscabies (strain Car8) TaxID=698760 RepID=L7ESS9_STRT8|nr:MULTISPECIES: DUF4097 family beta strand repeat-containing protein [Streptomyces]ELP62478.1 hypothetical protein STRTUCAR8_03415 [Streptomyces turgidiscabies Car8]MDX3494233.1 DUF4097 family beta strand repeat-containing protein [Streptomyces turgidiscabies]GAQ68393.1 hypothetical protein T45_00104 [Streptomyces turgidiscabies]